MRVGVHRHWGSVVSVEGRVASARDVATSRNRMRMTLFLANYGNYW